MNLSLFMCFLNQNKIIKMNFGHFFLLKIKLYIIYIAATVSLIFKNYRIAAPASVQHSSKVFIVRISKTLSLQFESQHNSYDRDNNKRALLLCNNNSRFFSLNLLVHILLTNRASKEGKLMSMMLKMTNL
jgi:hypothetical protein